MYVPSTRPAADGLIFDQNKHCKFHWNVQDPERGVWGTK